MNTPKNEHELKIHIDVDVLYPDHPPRTESRIFLHTKKHWHDIGAVCRVCKTSERIEIHHKFIEWADAGGVDWDKVRIDHPTFDWNNFRDPCDFIDSIYNTEPLCETHHRAPAPFGIHFTPGPIHQMQQYKRADFIYSNEGNK